MGQNWSQKKLQQDEAGDELQHILPREAQEHQREQPQSRPSKSRKILKCSQKVSYRDKEPKKVIHQEETCKGYLQLVQDGKFQEACLSILALAQEGQDCGLEYQTVAQSMWQVVQQALGCKGHSWELERKLQSVMAAIEWTQHHLENEEVDAAWGEVAAWGSQLRRLLERDAEALVPTFNPGVHLRPYLEALDGALGQGLGAQRADRLGAPLWDAYKACFQEVLVSRLCEVLRSHSHSRESYCTLYTWGKATLFGQQNRNTPLEAPAHSQKPTAQCLVDQLMFVSWMSQIQERLVALIQTELEEHLRYILTHDQKLWMQSSLSIFLEISQLLEETIKAVQHIGPPITSQVQAIVLERYSEFLKRYQFQVRGFLQNADAGTFPELHVLENCCILSKTWRELTQVYTTPAVLGPVVQDILDAIEGLSQRSLLSRLRTLCQSLLRGHFGEKQKDLVQALQLLWQRLDHCFNMKPTPFYASLLKLLYAVVFGEYVQALAAHLRTLTPGTWGHLQDQVDADTWKLYSAFQQCGGSGLVDLQEHIREIFQLQERKATETVDSWLASFGDRFPDLLSRQEKSHSSLGLEETEPKWSGCHCC
ncbi:uncharacterized protein [Saccopteryx bilineata]|uniref:uncharacterized protein n=1 Tax=Saccopteryx bilineata TaxID=59482 RepID=UPI00338EEEA3